MWTSLVRRWNKFGLRLRIMTYVTIGLVVLFGLMGFLGKKAVAVTTDEAFYERTLFAQELAQNMDNGFQHLAFHQ